MKMKTITNTLEKMRGKTAQDKIVDIIGSRISTPEEGFTLGRYLAETSLFERNSDDYTDDLFEHPEFLDSDYSEIVDGSLDTLNGIRKRCSNYLAAYEADRIGYGLLKAKRNSDAKTRKEAERLIDSVDAVVPEIINAKYERRLK